MPSLSADNDNELAIPLCVVPCTSGVKEKNI